MSLIDKFSLTHCGLVRHMVTLICVSIGSGNGLLPDGTKPLPYPMLTYHEFGPVTSISAEEFLVLTIKFNIKITYLKFH